MVELPRGGYLVDTSEGPVQFGAPPETIKDTLVMEHSVPRVFVVPHQMFNWQKGINVADMEFPIYFNYFLKGRRPIIVGREDQGERLRRAIREAVFGPEELRLSDDSYEAGDDVYVPDIRPELDFFRGGRDLDDLYEFRPLRRGAVKIGAVSIQETADGDYVVEDHGGGREVRRLSIPGMVHYQSKFDIGKRLPEPFNPPRFGVTCLGPSHGFDPKDNTSGFIIWLNHNGIMIDPPVDSTEWLLRSNVNPKFIDSIILTHAHADHDAGTFQKILEESRVTIYTTKTIMESFLRKYSAFSNQPISYLRRLFTFQPVFIGRPITIHGGEFDISYSVHSIPTMTFRLRFQGKTFVYSSDHQGDPGVQQKMFDDGVISRRRLRQLQEFPWDSDVIYHEAGIAPLHTPLAYLNSLPEEVKQKTVVYHISRKDFDKVGSSGLRHATFGIENTLYFDTDPFTFEPAYEVLDVLKRLDFFDSMPVSKVQEFLSIVEPRHYDRGQKVIEKGQPGRHFYIITRGNASVLTDKLVRSKHMGAFEYFGEVALLTNSARTADIIAETDLDVLTIEKNQFLNFIAGTEFEELLHRLINGRTEETWNTLVQSETLQQLTDYQKMWLESCLEPAGFRRSQTLIQAGKKLPGVYIVRNGGVEVRDGRKTIAVLGPGDLAGEMYDIQRDAPAAYNLVADRDMQAFYISAEDVQRFVRRNPGTAMRLLSRFE